MSTLTTVARRIGRPLVAAAPADDVYLDQIPNNDTPRHRPPLAWFQDPGLNGFTPITIDGQRVYGHIGTWDKLHIGYGGKPIYIPRSRTGYREFLRGGLVADDEGVPRIVAIGHLTADASHAGDRLRIVDTARHYDHSGWSWARVAVGEDAFGVWVAGILKPGVTDEQIDTALAHPPSGDWRPIGGNLELCAVLCVNTPGFGVDRARVASGELVSLVASAAPVQRKLNDGSTQRVGSLSLNDVRKRVAVNDARMATASISNARIGKITVSDANLGSASVRHRIDYDDMAERVANAIESRRERAELATRGASLLADLDETDVRVADLMAEVDEAPAKVDVLLASMDDGPDAEFVEGHMPKQLEESYLHGKAAAKIMWGTPGDFARCEKEAEHHGIPARMRPGMCARLHKLATGATPGHEKT